MLGHLVHFIRKWPKLPWFPMRVCVSNILKEVENMNKSDWGLTLALIFGPSLTIITIVAIFLFLGVF